MSQAQSKTIIPIIIIGGGPAGLSTALHLAQKAQLLASDILLLEKAQYPRPKLCAGGLSIDSEILLERLGLDVNEVPHADASTMHFDFEGKGLRLHNPRRHTLRVVRRNEFDAWLAEKAKSCGIEIREGISVRDVQPDAEGVNVITDQGEFRALAVVGADGSNGITRRSVLPNAPIFTARVLEVIVPILPHLQERLGHAYFDFFPVPEGVSGYIWDFPTQINGQPMRCWGVYDANLLDDKNRPALKEPLHTEMKRNGIELDEYKLEGYPIRWFEPSNQFSVSRVLLVGDAAGADPLFGEGISIALGFGALAAGALEKAFSTGDFSFDGYKRRLVWSALGQTLLARWFIANIIYQLKWRWFQLLIWRFIKPVVVTVAWVFILNWSKRLRS